MSLINDALKRAREAEQQRAELPPPAPSLQPVDYASRPGRVGWIVLAVLLVATLGLAAFYLGRWAGGSSAGRGGSPAEENIAGSLPFRETALASPPDPSVNAGTNLLADQGSASRNGLRAAPASATRADSPRAEPDPTATVAEPGQIEPAGTHDEDRATPAAPGAEVEAQFPELKLQSIVFRLRNPSVVINGEMLGVGDTIENARVAKIERHAVTMEWQGRTNVLRLPQF